MGGEGAAEVYEDGVLVAGQLGLEAAVGQALLGELGVGGSGGLGQLG